MVVTACVALELRHTDEFERIDRAPPFARRWALIIGCIVDSRNIGTPIRLEWHKLLGIWMGEDLPGLDLSLEGLYLNKEVSVLLKAEPRFRAL